MAGWPPLWVTRKSAAPPFAVFEGWEPQTWIHGRYRCKRFKKCGVEDAETENISSRKRSRFPPFERRKGWGSLNCGDTGTERVGQPAQIGKLVRTLTVVRRSAPFS